MNRGTFNGTPVAGRRSRVRLEITLWEALYDVAGRKGCSVSALVAEINRNWGKPNLSAAIRNYVVAYYREAAERVINDARR